MKILANDGISKNGVEELEAAGFEVSTVTVAQEQLENYINSENIVALLVRSATTVRKDLIDACPSLKIIGRGGVGMDNIDVEYAREKGLHVINVNIFRFVLLFAYYTLLKSFSSRYVSDGVPSLFIIILLDRFYIIVC